MGTAVHPATDTRPRPTEAPVTADLIESGAIEAHLPIQMAGTRPGRLHRVLAEANETARADAAADLARWLPDVPGDDRRREGLEPTRGRAGADLLSRVTGPVVLGLLDDLDARLGPVRLHNRGPGEVDVDRIQADTDRPRARATLNGVRLADTFAEGMSLQMTGLDLVVPDLARLAEATERTTGGHVMVRAFVAGGGAGVGRHSDDAETWIVHLEGTKVWNLSAPGITFYDPRRKAPGRDAAGAAVAVTLGPGDTLVVPRGHLHDVDPGPGLSVALGVMVDAPSRAALMEQMMAGVGARSEWLEPIHVAGREPTAPPVAPVDVEGGLLGELARWRASCVGRHVAGASTVLRAALDGGLGDLRLRSPLGGGMHVVDDHPWTEVITVAGGGRVLRLARRCLPLLGTVVNGRPFTADDLDWSGSRDDLVALVTALLREGVVGPAEPEGDAPD